MEAHLITSILFATVVAGTPLIIVALGQLVAERSGVLNLGAEGMMAMGAIAGFAGADKCWQEKERPRFRCDHRSGKWRSPCRALQVVPPW